MIYYTTVMDPFGQMIGQGTLVKIHIAILVHTLKDMHLQTND